ncbi:hypothetical protein CVS30_08755 [Arthrobacter psychrolactophilus]|uniref:YtxH domain-containing protein n=2 Tax=Arthrobacter psychrolactophilus TaxID=92442 RepID=A0A2V5IWM6_9MICC|nr:hypothetical protein CVS30_08755 [Arthrobacter psychrolactophilus]
MKAKLTFVAGLAAGYVLGTRAGRTSYERIKTAAKALWTSDAVQSNIATVQETVREQAADFAHKLIPPYTNNHAPDHSSQTELMTDPGSNAANPLDIVPEVSDEFPDSALSGSETGKVNSSWHRPEKETKSPA